MVAYGADNLRWKAKPLWPLCSPSYWTIVPRWHLGTCSVTGEMVRSGVSLGTVRARTWLVRSAPGGGTWSKCLTGQRVDGDFSHSLLLYVSSLWPLLLGAVARKGV